MRACPAPTDEQCPESYYSQRDPNYYWTYACAPCAPGCTRCNSDSSLSCTACAANLVLSKGECGERVGGMRATTEWMAWA